MGSRTALEIIDWLLASRHIAMLLPHNVGVYVCRGRGCIRMRILDPQLYKIIYNDGLSSLAMSASQLPTLALVCACVCACACVRVCMRALCMTAEFIIMLSSVIKSIRAP